jgi:hypothetical protein
MVYGAVYSLCDSRPFSRPTPEAYVCFSRAAPASRKTHAEAAPGRVWRVSVVRVAPNDTRFQLPHHAMRPSDVLRPHGRAEVVARGVRQRNGLFRSSNDAIGRRQSGCPSPKETYKGSRVFRVLALPLASASVWKGATETTGLRLRIAFVCVAKRPHPKISSCKVTFVITTGSRKWPFS